MGRWPEILINKYCHCHIVIVKISGKPAKLGEN